MAESTSQNEEESQGTPGNVQQDELSRFLGFSSKEGSLVFNFIITSAAAKIAADGAVAVAKELGGANVVEITKVVCDTTVQLATLYTNYKLLKPLIDLVIKKTLDKKNKKKVESIKPGSLHVVLRCFTNESFLEVLTDYESGKIKERLQIEFSKIGIEVEGLKIEIENMKEVEKTKADIEKRANSLKAKSFSKHKKTAQDTSIPFLPRACLMGDSSNFMVTTGEMLVRTVLNSTAVELGFATADATTALSDAVADATTALTDAVAGATTALTSSVASEVTKSVDTVGIIRSAATTTISLGALYIGYKMMKPLIETAVRKGLGGELDEQEVRDIKPG